MTAPQIFYLCYDHQRPTGGQKHTYQHVDVLSRNGYSAYVVHTRPGVKLTWFQNETPVISHDRFQNIFRPDIDFIVVPEDATSAVLSLPGRKVIFNKNIFTGFSALNASPHAIDPYLNPDVVAAFAVSAHNSDQLRYAYPHLDVYEVVMDLRPDVFAFEPLAAKLPRVATIVKDRQTALAFQIFRARADAGVTSYRACDWVFIQNVTEIEVAEILRRSRVFVWQSVHEGLGRLPLEAILSGSAVVGYAAGPLKDLLPRELTCDYANPAQMVRIVEALLAATPAELARLDEVLHATRTRIFAYGARQQEETVCAAWRSILAKAPVPTPPHHSSRHNEQHRFTSPV